MGLLRDLIERKHSDARDQAFRQHDAYKTIITDTRKPEEGGFSDEYKQEKLDEWLNLASPSKQHAKAVSPVFRHLLGLAGMIGGGGDKGQQPVAGGGGGVAVAQPQSRGLAVDSTGAPVQAGAGAGNVAAAPTTTGSVMGDTPSAMDTPAPATPARPSFEASIPTAPLARGGVSPRPSFEAQMPSAQLARGAMSDSVYNSVPGVSAPVGPPGTEGTTSVSPRVLTGDVSPEEEELATRSSFRGGQQPTGPSPTPDVGSTPKPKAQAQAPAVPERKAQAQPPAQAAAPGGRPRGFLSFEERMDRARVIAQHNVKLEGERMVQLQPYQQKVAEANLEQQLVKYKEILKTHPDIGPAYAATMVGLKVPGAAFTAGNASDTPVPANAIMEDKDPATGETIHGFNTRGGQFVKTRGTPVIKPNTGKETPADLNFKNAEQAYADELNAQHEGDANWKPVTVQTMSASQRVDAQRRAAGQLKQIEDALKAANPNWTPAQIKKAAGEQIIKNQNLSNRLGTIRIEQIGQGMQTVENRVKDSEAIAEGIFTGKDAPNFAGLSREQAGQVRAILNRRGFDAVNAMKDWEALKSHIHTMQGPIIQRQIQALKTVEGTIEQVKEAYANWQSTKLPTGFSDYNKAALLVSARLPGQSGVAARELIRQVGDFTAEVGSVYMQGNANTDHSLDLAKQNLAAEWNSQSFELALQNIQKFTQIRLNSIFNSGVVQPGQNRYDTKWELNPTGQSGGAGAVGGDGGAGSSFASGGYNYEDVTGMFDQSFAQGFKEGEMRKVPDSNKVNHIVKKFNGKLYEVTGTGGK